MRKGDLVWLLLLSLIVLFIWSPITHDIFVDFTTHYPYISGFIKFAILATMGELLVTRLRNGQWVPLAGLPYRSIVWGLLGMLITLIFVIYANGVQSALDKGYLLGKGSSLLTAFYISAIMNITFAPMMMGLHKLTDAYIDLRFKERATSIKISDMVSYVDWQGFIGFVIIKTIPFFWIPAHTITFLLPPQYRVIMAAFLSIALGILLSVHKKTAQS